MSSKTNIFSFHSVKKEKSSSAHSRSKTENVFSIYHVEKIPRNMNRERYSISEVDASSPSMTSLLQLSVSQ